MFRVRLYEYRWKHPPGEQQTFGESRYFIGDVAIALGSLPRVIWSSFTVLRVFYAAGSQLGVHENTSWVVSGCLWLLSGAPDALFLHVIRSFPQFRWLYLLVRSCSYPQVKCKHSVGSCFVVSFGVPQIPSNSDHCSTSKSRCRPLLRTCGRPIWRELPALWMKHSLITTRYLQDTNQPKVQTQRVKIALEIIIPIKDTSGNRDQESPGHPGMGGGPDPPWP